MVSNKNRKTKYEDIEVEETVAKEFYKHKLPGETKTDTMRRILKKIEYNCKCPELSNPGIAVAD